MRMLEIVGGPKDGQRYSFDGNARFIVIPEPSGSFADWLAEPDPSKAGPMPTYSEVHYKVTLWHGKTCAVHPKILEANK